MKTIKIVSLNILIDHRFWEKRESLIVSEIKKLAPDIIAFQEILKTERTNHWLKNNFPDYRVFFCPKTGLNSIESVALLSKIPVISHETLSLGTQKRVAQMISIQGTNKVIHIANTHMYFNPLTDRPRVKQAQRLTGWLPKPGLVCGDYNAEPYYPSMIEMKKRFRSAYVVAHGKEPEWTCPTSLRRGPSFENGIRHVGLRAAGIYKHRENRHWQGVLDYIYIDQEIELLSCEIAFDKPSDQDKRIYASDHLGLVAEIKI